MKAITSGIVGLGTTVAASIIFILLGIVYYMVTVFVIKTGAGWAGYPGVDGGTVVLTAGIVSAAAIIGSSLKQ